jgi:hypothetical protein
MLQMNNFQRSSEVRGDIGAKEPIIPNKISLAERRLKITRFGMKFWNVKPCSAYVFWNFLPPSSALPFHQIYGNPDLRSAVGNNHEVMAD